MHIFKLSFILSMASAALAHQCRGGSGGLSGVCVINGVNKPCDISHPCKTGGDCGCLFLLVTCSTSTSVTIFQIPVCLSLRGFSMQ
ncbi:unnamed protein product [Zymoseptoria tritici ST99CH_1A5]|uniref:Uncharacterized protein n=2 Tax=Zymoseptoria tritici TaxID=1047171 RepID=A0A1X7RM25_ZYMT9|nr:unnamed protein product [Zymoseptoria tritici ST99CH_3D7]SMY22162.1 unnamed protein product [Zymoseptoria tritici ST99CH_1A5]